MLIHNKTGTTFTIGSIALIPGVNTIDNKVWDEAMASKKWKRPLQGAIKDGKIEALDSRDKLTIETVKNTVDEGLLQEWLADPKHKGPLKGAIKAQIEALKLVTED